MAAERALGEIDHVILQQARRVVTTVADHAAQHVGSAVDALEGSLDELSVGSRLGALAVELAGEGHHDDAIVEIDGVGAAEQRRQDGIARLDVLDDVRPPAAQVLGCARLRGFRCWRWRSFGRWAQRFAYLRRRTLRRPKRTRIAIYPRVGRLRGWS